MSVPTSGPAHQVAVTVDLARSIGLAATLRRLRQELELRGVRAPIGDAYPHIWRAAAEAVGASVTELGNGELEVVRGDRRTRVNGRFTPLDGEAARTRVRDKSLINHLLVDAGVLLPEYVELAGNDLAGARAFMSRVPAPWVVKPAGASGGQGVTTGLRSWEEFALARRRALLEGSRLLLERHVEGDVYRVLLLDGSVLDVIRRLPSRVTGDGVCRVSELIETENRTRLNTPGPALSLIFIDLECVLTLRAQGLTLDSVPARGRVVALKTVTNQNGARDNFTVREPLSEDLIDQTRKAAHAAGIRLAGVDVVTTDIAKPLHATRGAVLEANVAPGLHYHHAVADPARATPVAVPVLEALLA